jgi:hypothetical protein
MNSRDASAALGASIVIVAGVVLAPGEKALVTALERDEDGGYAYVTRVATGLDSGVELQRPAGTVVLEEEAVKCDLSSALECAQGGARVVQERCVIADCREPDGTWNDKHAPVDCRAGGPFHSKDADAGRWFGCNRIPREHARGTQCVPIPCTVLAGDRLPGVKERR